MSEKKPVKYKIEDEKLYKQRQSRSTRKERYRRRKSDLEIVEHAAESLINSLQKDNMDQMKNNYVYFNDDKTSDNKLSNYYLNKNYATSKSHNITMQKPELSQFEQKEMNFDL